MIPSLTSSFTLGVKRIDFPAPYSPKASPEPDGAPLSTQATLVASPLIAQKKLIPTPGPTPTKVVEPQESAPRSMAAPSSQQTSVVTQELQRARVRGATAQPGPSVPRETRTRGGVAPAEAPFRNTRVRSRSVDPQPEPEPGRARLRNEQGGRVKGKAREDMLVAIEEDVQVDEGVEHVEEDVEFVAVTSGLSMRETLEDEMAVQGLLKVSVASVEEHEVVSVRDEDEDEEDGDDDEDMAMNLPRFQVVEVSEPTDSDDAETHGSLVRGTIQEGSVGGSDAEPGQDRDEEQERDEDADADRIERMASRSLHAVPPPTPLQPRLTRSQTRTQAQAQMQKRTSPRRTRYRDQVHQGGEQHVFPSPGTKAKAVVDRVQKEERRTPYAPPEGSRAAKAKVTRGGGKRK